MTQTLPQRADLAVELPTLPALVVGRVHHIRHTPFRRAFENRHYQWLLDLDEPLTLPRWLGPVACFRPEDHLSGPSTLPELKANVLRCLGRDGIPTSGVTRVVALTHARVLGHVFDPMTAYWCLTAAGELRGVVVEVHNTYGGRHAYAVRPDARGAASVDKDFYVSPFNPVEGDYEMRVPEPAERLGVAIVLHREEQTPFTATMTGHRLPATTANVVRMALAVPLAPLRVVVQIRWQGIRLWLRRLPISPRPLHEHQEAVR